MSFEIPRAEVIGSMLRPEGLKQARDRHAAGELGAAELKRIEDAAVVEAIAIQERAGVAVVTDGEMRRSTFMGPLTDVVSGVARVEGALADWHDEDGTAPRYQPAVIEKLTPRRSLAVEEYSFARAVATVPVKVTLPSPLMLALTWSPVHSTAAYDDPFDCFADAAAIIASEARALVELGCGYIQIDAPELATLVDPAQRHYYEGVGVPPQRMLTEGVELLNQMVAGIDAQRGIHLCRGNNAGKWMSEGGYDEISKQVFARAGNFDVLLLEYDDLEREGGFEPLADVPDEKIVVLGLVSTKHAELEPADELVAKVKTAGRFHPTEQMALSTQCGFASVLEGNPVPWESQEAKLRLVTEVAERVWG
ncbi:MAG TPA: cobalamin-independent methionine synthase II family protein [Solirubrobacteraceae bacterium]|jgi:5-methyltetrahydropteroyltriglutamate--homocysteine methyltransferase|nr:cobalamin-independent methionine synthase II family protein [Solirubrobacteraceae bacterium]